MAEFHYNYVVQLMPTIINIFLLKASSSNAISNKLAVTVLLLPLPVTKRSAQCHVLAQSPPDRRPNDKYPVNSSHRYDLCKNVSFAVLLFGGNGNSCTVCTVSDMCVCAHVLHNSETGVGQGK